MDDNEFTDWNRLKREQVISFLEYQGIGCLSDWLTSCQTCGCVAFGVDLAATVLQQPVLVGMMEQTYLDRVAFLNCLFVGASDERIQEAFPELAVTADGVWVDLWLERLDRYQNRHLPLSVRPGSRSLIWGDY